MSEHRGQILKRVLEKYKEEVGLSIAKIAKKAGYDQSMPYRHFNQPDLALHIIRRYGRVIKHDFIDVIPEMAEDYKQFQEELPQYNRPESVKELVDELDKWKVKYIELLEKHNQLLREKLERSSN